MWSGDSVVSCRGGDADSLQRKFGALGRAGDPYLYFVRASLYFQHEFQQTVTGLARARADGLVRFVVQDIDSSVGVERKDHWFGAHPFSLSSETTKAVNSRDEAREIGTPGRNQFGELDNMTAAGGESIFFRPAQISGPNFFSPRRRRIRPASAAPIHS